MSLRNSMLMEDEKSPYMKSKDVETNGADNYVVEREGSEETSWQKFDRINRKFEAKLGIEARGIERVPPELQTDTRLSGNTSVWLAANTVLSTFGIGILAPLVFYMGLGDSLLTIFFFNVFTAILPAFMSTFGPKLGLRQMTSGRFSWGWWGAKIVAIFNCIACVGWSCINSIGGGQVLSVAANEKFSAGVGVVIIAVITLVLGFFGYKVVHAYERYSWIPTAITFFVLLGVSAKHLVNVPMPVGQAEAASVLSMGGTVFGFTAGWVSLASDYNVYMPASAPSWKVFSWTYLGLIFPLILVEWLGAAIGCVALANDDWFNAYDTQELGGLINIAFADLNNVGAIRFFEILLVLSVVANNIINVYSMGMSISVVGPWFAATPRWIWPIFITAIYIPLGIVGANSFSSSLENFMNVLGYWLAIYVTVYLEEHFIFRKGKYENYNVEDWNNPKGVPIGIAAIAAGCVGVCGAVLGMAQIWFIGPIGKAVGGTADPYGGDVGFEMAAAFAGITYPVFRLLEKRFIGR